MKANKVTAEDIKNIGTGGKIEVELPNYLACVAAKGAVTYVKRAYPRTDGNVYYTFLKGNTITIGLTDPHTRDVILFQFHKGTIRTPMNYAETSAQANFNSIKVQLELVC